MLEPEIAALHDGAVDRLGVFVEPSLVLLRTSRIDHDVARAADLRFGVEAELHLALEHPNDLLICVTVAMKVLVCGGRNFRSPAQVFRALDRLHQEKPITELMQGGATGAGPIQAAPWVWRANWESNPIACARIGPLPGRFDTVEKRPNKTTVRYGPRFDMCRKITKQDQ